MSSPHAPEAETVTAGIGTGDVRTYRGRTVQELIPQIRAELGADAIILREREGLTGGIGGFFAQRCVEIEAQAAPRLSIYADDDELDEEDGGGDVNGFADLTPAPPAELPWVEIAAAAPTPVALPAFDEPTFAAELVQAEAEPDPASPFVARPLVAEPVEIRVPVSIEVPKEDVSKPGYLYGTPDDSRPEAAAVKALVAVEAPAVVEVPDAVVEVPAAVAEAPAAPALPVPARPSATDALQRRLLNAGFSRKRANELIGLALEVTDDDADLTDAVCEEIVAALPRDGVLPLTGGAIAIVGAGGSGKTRCVAAMAVALARSSARTVSVALLGTPERATELAELMRGESVEVIPAMRTRATVRAVTSARQRGLVIIDTPSASPTDRSAIEVLAETLAPFDLDGIYLTVPATFTARAAGKLTEGFAALGLRGIVATHVDEVDQLGVVAELSMQTGLPLSHTHTGTDVTTAIRRVNQEELTEVMLP